jgi:NADH-quinone oxidoreductase subunit I
MKKAIIEIYCGLKSLFVGLRITLGQFFRPLVTVQYPHETLKIPARFRGHIELVRDPATGKAKCFVCKLCEKACPSDCITVDGVKPEGAKRKAVTQYRLDFTKCSLCGSCVEACRDSAIRFSREYNLAGLSKEDFVMDLFKRLEAEGRLASAPDGVAVITGAHGGHSRPGGDVIKQTAAAVGPQNSQPPVAGSQPAIGGTPAPSAPAPLAELKPEAK